ncbi:unnamed protein product (macronuclear) [Paramecium tetraurelia]|uniref:Protein BFR2 n=1 Tax=Paramecium tetraurelia TaxID=5888 RepID=A0CVL6_PARTE|nr:uncharacterized protein GSPATT00011001001 [Paramecium tetraurelia]CAK74833.1 unnamed protein product [Paramecium tetraurelia]|eukprot:XP_001442230.1 hypothetical protein (macronuclear) [Paramecium tetraurelia strain d4-2]
MSKIKQKKKALIKHSIDPENDHEDQLSYDSIDDEQYLNLLQGHVPKSHKVDIHLGSKYQGKKTNNQQQHSQSEDDLQNESINSDEIPEFIESEQEESEDQQQRKTVQQKPKKKQNLSTFQKELQQIEKEDLEMVEKQKENKKELKEVADQIKEQQQIWGNLVEIREQMQKSLDAAKRLPILKDSFVTELQKSKDSKLNDLNCQLLNNITNLLNLYSSLYQIDQINLNDDGYDPNSLKKVNDNLEDSIKVVEDDIIRWSSKSALLSSLNKDSKSQMGFLLLTPIGQSKKALQNMDKLRQKTQLKRQIFRILGEEGSDLSETTNKHIFDDTDFYLDLLKETVSFNNQNPTEEALKKETEQQEKENKVVDRKASKNRKIRFEPHQKIVNFTSRIEPPVETISREEIIKNLFGLTSTNIEPQVQKKRKQSIHDVNLI